MPGIGGAPDTNLAGEGSEDGGWPSHVPLGNVHGNPDRIGNLCSRCRVFVVPISSALLNATLMSHPSPRSRETSVATIELVSPGLIELRYKPTATFDPSGLVEIIRASASFWQEGPCSVMVVIPAEMTVDPPQGNLDHLARARTHGQLEALAVVTDSEAMHMAVNVYFMYFPQPFPVEVFGEEYDALKWLRARPFALGLAAG